MSWTKGPQGGALPPGPERQPYAASQAQPFGNQESMYPNYQGVVTGNMQQQPQFWQMPPQQQPQPQYNQQYGQVYQQQEFPANANQFYPPTNTYNNMNYANQAFNPQQARYTPQQNYYPNQGHENLGQQQNFTQAKPNADSWEDNWDWGWEADSSKQAQKAAHNAVQQPLPPPQQVVNNANVIEESFSASDTNCWNWAMDDKKDAKEPAAVPTNHEPATVPTTNPAVENNVIPESVAARSASNMSAQQSDDVRTLNDRDVVKERLPNLALGKRFHLDNLTPQWSIESQMSQESSDGLHTQSEGTYRSENQSRNSSKSSPGLNTDNSNFNYSQPGLDEGFGQNSEWSRPSDEPTLADSTENNSRRDSHDELSSSLQEMSLVNHENPSTDHLLVDQDMAPRYILEQAGQPPPAVSPASFPPPVSNLPPPPTAAMPPAPPVSSVQSSTALSVPPSSSSLPPPNIPPPTLNSNPFKHAGPFSHKSLPKGSVGTSSVQPFPPQMSSTNLTSPAVVSKVSQHNRVPVGFEANLETTPDNSERPDQPQLSAFRTMPVSQQVPDNMEVAPRNDRNEYLQTAHLSSGDFGENTDFSRSVPPPGLRRMVVGQQESEYSQSLNISGDEPPPGLARMVPGQQNEIDTGYNQPSDNYLDRHIDGQTTDDSTRPYRQADGQQTPDNYTQAPPSRVTERRPIGLDRMVPGEPSSDEYSQYQSSNYAGANEQRVVTGVDHDFSIPADAGPTDVREQNVDGSDYTEQSLMNPPRNVIGARESSNDVSPDFTAPPDEQQREVTMEGENLQDLSMISSTELTYSREQVLDGADIEGGTDRKTDLSDSAEHAASSSRRQSLNRVNTSGEDSERDRAFKSSPRRDKHKSSRDRDRDRDRDRERDRDRDRDKDGRYSRGDRKYDPDRRSTRDERRTDKERRDREGYRERREQRDESPDARRHRRSTRSHRYETEDTDYYSDRERERRRHREGSHISSKPPRPEDKDRRYDERDRSKRYNTIERERRYDDERDSRRRGDRYRDRYERAYRDIDPTRKYGNLRRPREKEDPRRVVTFSPEAKTNDSCLKHGTEAGEFASPSRPDSREATATDDDGAESRRRDRRSRRTAEPFYDEYSGGAGYTDAYLAQRQQYQYYEHLRLTNPAAYMQLYKQIMAGHAPPPPPLDYRAPPSHNNVYPDDFTSLAYDRHQERGSVHSGRSSTTGLKGNDTYYAYRHDAAASLRDAPSLRTDLSDRDLNTDMSLNLHLEESTVRSERMTPFRYSTAHIKGSIGSRDVVVVRPAYPVDGAPATVHVLSLAAALAPLPDAQQLAAFPGPLLKGVTHKKSVIDYCGVRMRSAEREGGRDVIGYILVWDLLALMLRQNGVVMGSDIAELLMKNTREYEHRIPNANKTHNESRRGSALSGEAREPRDDGGGSSPEQPSLSVSDNINQESLSSPGQSAADERVSLDKLRELLIYGNRQEALEWAMSNKLWGHALALAAHGERRARAAVTSRFVAALPRRDPLHTLYAALAAAPPPAVTCVSDERWGDWRPHAAMMLSNPSAKPEHDRRTLTQLGDSLSSRGLLYCAQFCYLSAKVPFCRHPLAPLPPADALPPSTPRLALLLADPRAVTLQQLATNRALFATEVYEYATSLNQDDFVISELQAYKLILACRLSDCGLYERALAYTEAAARAVTRDPRTYSSDLVTHLATLADRLKYHDPALHDDPPLMEEADSAEPSPTHHQQWLHDVKNVAHMLKSESEALSAHASPRHAPAPPAPPAPPLQQGGWGEQLLMQAQQYQQIQPVPTYEPVPEDKPDYSSQYYAPQQHTPEQQQQQQQQPTAEEQQQYAQYEDWPRPEEQHQQYADPYWHDQSYTGYGEGVGGGAAAAGGEEARPAITMPGSSKPRAPYDYDDDRPSSADQDRDTDTPKTAAKKQESRSKDEGKDSKGSKGGGWLGGILNKLSLRAPNQMILPDDKNPSIVWDADSKRWRDVAGDAAPAPPPPPPPRAADLPHAMQSASPPLPPGMAPAGAPPAATPAPPVSNIFKMQKGRHIKKSYVDVFNPSGAPHRALPPAADVLGPAAPVTAPTNYFVPAPLPMVAIERPEAIEVSMPLLPDALSPSSSTPKTKSKHKSGVYDPSTGDNGDSDMYRSGI